MSGRLVFHPFFILQMFETFAKDLFKIPIAISLSFERQYILQEQKNTKKRTKEKSSPKSIFSRGGDN